MGRKIQIKPSVNIKVEEMLREAATRRKTPYGVLVNEALEQYFDPDSVKTREAILLKRLDQVERKVLMLANNINIFSEAFAIFVKTYLARLEEIPSGQEQIIQAKANKLFKQFLEQIKDSALAGNNLFNDLPQDEFITDSEAMQILKDLDLKEKNYEHA